MCCINSCGVRTFADALKVAKSGGASRSAFCVLYARAARKCLSSVRFWSMHKAYHVRGNTRRLSGEREAEGSICQDGFPDGSLKNDCLTITGSLIKASEPKAAVNIVAMSDEQARKVISQICSLSETVAYALGRLHNSGCM